MWIVFIITGAVLAAALFILTPRNIPELVSQPDPAQDYGEALRRVERLRKEVHKEMNPLCRLQFFTHGKKTSRAVLLIHGYTSCPQQFRKLGEQLHDSGSNVLIAPLPRHGFADRMTEEHSKLRAEELAAYADKVADIAAGLGKETVMMGLSTGGLAAAWAAEHRHDIALAVVISPAFGFRKIPTVLTAAAMNIFSVLPDKYTWWNPELQAQASPAYAYPRYSRRTLTQILRLGFAVQRDIERGRTGAKKIVVVFNHHDDQINNKLTQKIVERWQAGNANITTYDFDDSLGLAHDFIDPNHPDQKIALVYPKLLELVNP